MKKLLFAIVLIASVVALAGCVQTKPAPEQAPAPMTSMTPFDILQHKGTVLGVNTPPNWVVAAMEGPKAVEKLPDYKDKYVVVVDVTGKDLEGTRLAAQRLNADTEIARFLSIRVKDAFAGAQVGDKDKIETYMERVVKSVSETRFSGFRLESDWWVQIRWYKPDGKKTFDRDEFRVMQLYTIEKDLLMEQLRKILDSENANEPKTPEKERAIQAVQSAFADGF